MDILRVLTMAKLSAGSRQSVTFIRAHSTAHEVEPPFCVCAWDVFGTFFQSCHR